MVRRSWGSWEGVGCQGNRVLTGQGLSSFLPGCNGSRPLRPIWDPKPDGECARNEVIVPSGIYCRNTAMEKHLELHMNHTRQNVKWLYSFMGRIE